MQLPSVLHGESPKRLLQGAAIGAVATIVIGFAWGGWTLGSTATQMADKSASAAAVAALAPICVDQFQRTAEATANLAELKKVGSWQQGSYVEKGGWATMPGSDKADAAVAQACANMLSSLKVEPAR